MNSFCPVCPFHVRVSSSPCTLCSRSAHDLRASHRRRSPPKTFQSGGRPPSRTLSISAKVDDPSFIFVRWGVDKKADRWNGNNNQGGCFCNPGHLTLYLFENNALMLAPRLAHLPLFIASKTLILLRVKKIVNCNVTVKMKSLNFQIW